MKKYLLLIACLVSAFLQIHAQERAPIQRAILYDWYVTSSIVSDEQSFTAEYQAILNRATALGYTKPSAAQQVKQNQLIVNLKAAGIWSQLDVFYVFATDGSSDFATLNWITPTLYQCSKVNSPTFTINQGFNGNGSTSYISTNYATQSGTKGSLNSASYGLYMATQITVGQATQIAGTDDASNILALNNTIVQRINNSTNNLNNSIVLGNTVGYKAINRSNVSQNELYDGNTQFIRFANSTSLTTRPFLIGTRGSNFNNAIYSMFFSGNSLTLANHNNFNLYFVSYSSSL